MRRRGDGVSVGDERSAGDLDVLACLQARAVTAQSDPFVRAGNREATEAGERYPAAPDRDVDFEAQASLDRRMCWLLAI